MDALIDELLAVRKSRKPCALVIVAETKGSAPRAAGAKMLVYLDGSTSGTIGCGKFEVLAIEEVLACLRDKRTLLKNLPVARRCPRFFRRDLWRRGDDSDRATAGARSALRRGRGSFCAGDCASRPRVRAFGARRGRSGRAFRDAPGGRTRISVPSPADFIASGPWQSDEAIVLISRNHELDRAALDGAMRNPGPGSIEMIGSRRKVRKVFEHLRGEGISDESLCIVHAPIGLDIAAHSPAEIAVSAVAKIL
ncbi:MAG: XdhC family protein [Spartobacteria bacterium]